MINKKEYHRSASGRTIVGCCPSRRFGSIHGQVSHFGCQNLVKPIFRLHISFVVFSLVSVVNAIYFMLKKDYFLKDLVP